MTSEQFANCIMHDLYMQATGKLDHEASVMFAAQEARSILDKEIQRWLDRLVDERRYETEGGPKRHD